jgi:hypothetical protein
VTILRPAFLAVVSVALPLLAACTSAKPASGTYTIGFPSTAAAVATVDVTVYVYPYAGSVTCQALVQGVRTQAGLATPQFQVGPISPCKLLSSGGTLDGLSFGDYSFLAVARAVLAGQTMPQNFLVGCASQTISGTNTNVTIPMELASETVELPMGADGGAGSACQSLSQHCSGGC